MSPISIDAFELLPPPDDLGSQDTYDDWSAQATGLVARAAAPITRQQVAANARDYAESSHYFGPGQCLQFSRRCALALGGVYDAKAAWGNARFKHRMPDAGVAPAGTFVFWQTGPHWHVAVAAGGGRAWSTDVLRQGRVDLVTISSITLGWNAPLVGWTEDINSVHPLDQDAPEDDMPYTPEELRDALRPMVREVVDNQVAEAMSGDALRNSVRLAIEAERAEDAAAVWKHQLVNPITGELQSAGTFVRYATARLEDIKQRVILIATKVGAAAPK